MMHPDKSMLLAYTRQQLCHNSSRKIQRHIEICQVCCMCCEEYTSVNTLLQTWAQSCPVRLDASLANRVLQRGNMVEVPFADRLKSHLSPTSWRVVSLPIAMILVCLCTVVIIALARGLSEQNNGTVSLQQEQTAVATHTTIPLQPTLNVTNTPVVVSGGLPPVITVCTTPQDLTQSHLRVCGAHFTPGSQVELVIEMAGKEPRMLPPVLVDARGTMQDVLVIPSCNAVPLAIVAQNVTNQAETSQLLEKIAFKNCPNL